MTTPPMSSSVRSHTSFGDLLRHWRTRRGRTQFDLAHHAGFSQRHLSFLESGRSRPSRSAVIILADALDVPVGERNALLQAAGFAPLYTADALDSARLRFALDALESVVESHRPFPAVIVDRAWNVLRANGNALALFSTFIPSLRAAPPDQRMNAMRVCIEPGEFRDSIRNWLPFVAALLGQLKAEEARAPHPGLRELIELIEADAQFQRGGREAAGLIGSPVATLQLERDGVNVELFTLLSTFGTATDASLVDLRVETFFPANEASRQVLRRLDETLAARRT